MARRELSRGAADRVPDHDPRLDHLRRSLGRDLARRSKVIAAQLGAKGQTIISPNGVPGNVSDVAFTSAMSGVAVGGVATCPNGKASCVSTRVVTRTDDGGQDATPIP